MIVIVIIIINYIILKIIIITINIINITNNINTNSGSISFIPLLLECSSMVRETWVQSQVASYQRL